MRYKKLDLNMLPALRALLTEKNVTRAAEHQHVTQSAMSSILARLRDYFEDQLIVPFGRRLELTALGELLLGQVNDLLLRIDTTLGTKPEFQPEISDRKFSIVSSDYVNTVFLSDVLRGLYLSAPGLIIELRQPSDAALPSMLAGELDFHIHPDNMLHKDHPSVQLFQDTFHAVVDKDNQDIGDEITLSQYKNCGHVIFRNFGMPLFDRWYGKTHGELKSEVVVSSFGMLAPLVISTRRIATVHTRMALKAAETLPIRLVKLQFETPPFVEMLQWHAYRDNDPGIVWMRDKIVKYAKSVPELAEM
jgi:DNA-binding transcriptional LysR family regulator